MPEDVSVVLVGIGGYGHFYLRALLPVPPGVRFVGAVDPAPERCDQLDALRAAGVPIYPSLEAFDAQHQADLAIIVAPIHRHLSLTETALAHGSHVLCEKPAAATIQDVRALADAEAQSGRFVAIGYQWSYSPAMRALKRDILAGAFGAPVQLKTCVFWPRTAAYYGRSPWAGRIRAETGEWVLDSPVHNATAHYLHNMLYVLGPAIAASAYPQTLQAELYRANPIENYDAAALRVTVESGAELLFYTAHSVRELVNPRFEYRFERATITYEADGAGVITAWFDDGREARYGDPDTDSHQKLWDALDSARTGAPLACGVAAATPQVICVNAAQDSTPVVDLPGEALALGADRLMWVDGLQDAFTRAYEAGRLPSELGDVPWARAGAPVSLRGYDHFPGGSEKKQ